MSKRCCAQNCFNSTLYTKNVSYFHFPKNQKFADQWADLAGRSDLKKKPLLQVIKYFLCSEHFATNCFVDQDTRQILKRQLPHSIALPTIFKNNLQETMHVSNPKQTIEVHNIVIVGGDESREINTNSVFEEIFFDEEHISRDCFGDVEGSVENEKQREIAAAKLLDKCDIQEQLSCHNEEHSELELDLEDSENIPLTQQTICRLCLMSLTDDEPATKLQDSLHLQEFIKRVMGDKISLNDEFSQVVCKNCENNSLLCLIIIQQMDATQEQITSSSNQQNGRDNNLKTKS